MLLNLSPLSVEFRFPPRGAIPWRLVVRLSLLMYYPPPKKVLLETSKVCAMFWSTGIEELLQSLCW